MRFNDAEYLKAYYERGEYPKIHDDIMVLAKDIEGNVVLDLGCCTGLLTRRLAINCKKVIGIDSNKHYLEQAIRDKNNIEYVHLKICENTLQQLREIIFKNNIGAVVARRVFPEIYETGGFELINDVLDIFDEELVSDILIEGRKSNRNAINPLNDIEKELKAVSRNYEPIKRYKNCALLQRR